MPRSSQVWGWSRLGAVRSPCDLSGVTSLSSIAHLASPLCHTQARLPLPFTLSLGLHTLTQAWFPKKWAMYSSYSCTLDHTCPRGKRWARRRPSMMELTGTAKFLAGLCTSFCIHNLLWKSGVNLLAFHLSCLSHVFFLSLLHGTLFRPA